LPSIATTLLSEKNFYFDKTVPIEAVTPETSVLFSIIPLAIIFIFVVFFCFPIIIRKEVDGKLEQKVEYEGIWRAEDIKLQISDKDDDYELSEGIDDAVESEANVSQSKGFDLVDYLHYATFGRSDQVEENLSSGFSDFLNDDKDEEEENQESPPLADVDNNFGPYTYLHGCHINQHYGYSYANYYYQNTNYDFNNNGERFQDQQYEQQELGVNDWNGNGTGTLSYDFQRSFQYPFLMPQTFTVLAIIS
jgi:hypothetical protein